MTAPYVGEARAREIAREEAEAAFYEFAEATLQQISRSLVAAARGGRVAPEAALLAEKEQQR